MKNWRELLYGRWDSDRSQRISTFIASDKIVFGEVFNAFYAEEGHIAHRSGFILGQTFKRKPDLLIPRIGILLDKMPDPPHEWYRWMTIWYLSHCQFPAEKLSTRIARIPQIPLNAEIREIRGICSKTNEHDGLAATFAFEELGKSHNKPAVKNASMRLLEFICKRNPELIPEYKLYLEEIIRNERPTLATKAKKQMEILRKEEFR